MDEKQSNALEMVGMLILGDDDEICEVVSTVNNSLKDPDGIWFLTHNKKSGAKYRVSIRIEEI